MTVSVAQAQLFFLALTRVLAMTIHVPVLAGQSVPNQIKLGFGLLLTLCILQWKPLPAAAPPDGLIAFGWAIGREILIGTIAGFAAVLTFAALQVAGEMMGMSSGFTAARTLNPALEMPGTSVEQFFMLASLLLFFAINGPQTFLLALQHSFAVAPLNAPLPDLSSQRMLQMVGQMIVIGLQMALPVTAALLMTDLTLGLLARVAPQVQVFFLGLPLKIALGLLAIGLSFSILSPNLTNLFQSLGQRMTFLLGG
jgi:flagellar biosynthetic protein FliR